MSVSIALIPSDVSKPLQTYHIPWDTCNETTTSTTKRNNGALFALKLHRRILSLLHNYNSESEKEKNETKDIDSDDNDDGGEDDGDLSIIDDRVEVPLLRPLGKSPGLYAYYRSGFGSNSGWKNMNKNKDKNKNIGKRVVVPPNIRATRLAMACGLMSMRFHGMIILVRSNPTASVGRKRWFDVTADDIRGPCEVSPDLRTTLQAEALQQLLLHHQLSTTMTTCTTPLWIKNAAEQNYHDAAVLARMAEVMDSSSHETKTNADDNNSEIESEGNDDNDDDDDSTDDDENNNGNDNSTTTRKSIQLSNKKQIKTNIDSRRRMAVKSPLCLHCRRSANHLCEGCQGAYFCCSCSPPTTTTYNETDTGTGTGNYYKDDCSSSSSSSTSTTTTTVNGNGNDKYNWSHSCQCQTWKLYVSRRVELSTFEYLNPEWQKQLVGREFQLSEQPYKKFLTSLLLLNINTKSNNDNDFSLSSWWRTETDGWSGGESQSAKEVDISLRCSFEEGFAPIPIDQLPPSRRVTEEDFDRVAGGSENSKLFSKTDLGLWKLSSWEDYYRLRGIPPQSPIALLCTFPLTIYHAIVQYGEVPVTVARMLNRPLRIHVVGTEKELNFLDLFQELGYLLPEDLKVELIFVARADMLPKKIKSSSISNGDDDNDGLLLRVEMTDNLTVGVVGGTYGGEMNTTLKRHSDHHSAATTVAATVLDPTWDVGSGPPDMVISLNAGLYAYESWRSVIEYLSYNKSVVGVFTDYNEYSGVHCAGLGGAASRESLCINPFRQPLAMPVYSMNLPQFSNGFFYVFNAQEVE